MRRKRYLSALLALCVLLTLFPVRAAEEAAERPVGPLRQIDAGGGGGGGSGSKHYAVIDANGDLWTWGANNSGQLGDGTTTARSEPVKIMDGVSSVSLGGWHSAAIKTDGSLWTWGNNNSGRLGDGTTTYRSEPVKIMDGVSSVNLGNHHSAAIKTDGSLWMWGDNVDAQLGNGTRGATASRYEPVKILDNVSSVGLGSQHSAAIKTDGSLWAWGGGIRYEPVKTTLDNVSGVSLGGGNLAALRMDGSLWTWGYNYAGGVGDGTTSARYEPVKIMDGVSSVSLGGYHSAAIKTDGSLWMWGGEHKDYSSIAYSTRPVKVADKVRLIGAGYNGGLFVSGDYSLWQYTLNGIPPSKTKIEIDYLPGLYIDTESLTLAVNESATIGASVYPASDRDSALVWASSAPDVAAVENGVVTGKGAGEADITVMAAKTGDTAVCHVTVPAPLTLDKDAVTLRVGETFQLTPTLRRAPDEETGVAWFSTAPDVASVSDGFISALASGTATVSVVTLDGEYKADCVVTVPHEATGIELDRASLTMKPGDSVTLTASVIPEDAFEKDVRWMSSTPNVATVSDGLVKAWSVGKTTVTVTTVFGGFTASCTVNVTENGAEPEPPTYTVTFDAGGGTVSPTSKTVTRGEPYGDLPAPTRDGYQFAGWFTAPDGGTQVNSDTKVNLSGAQTLYARWTPALKVPGLAELTYSFANSASGLGYPKPYRIPYERYKMIFGDTVSAKWYFMASGDWGGDCYGFTSTAAMFSQSGNGVDTNSFRDGATLPAQLQTGDKNASWNLTAREFLECMQVSQNSPLIQRDYLNNKNKLNELCAAVKAYQENGTNPVIAAVFGRQGGHALLAYKIEQDKLYVYDCNYPATERYITLRTDSSGNYVGWYYPINNSIEWGSAFKESWISFIPYADFYSIWANRGRKSDAKTELLTVNADVVLKDFDGVPIASVESGELVTTQPDIFPLIEIGITPDGLSPKKDGVSFWIPVGIYDLERKGDSVRAQGEVVLMDAENPFKASVTHVDQSAEVSTTSDRFTFVVDDESELNRVMFPSDAAKGSYDVTFQSTLMGKQQDARIVGNVSANALTFAMVGGEAVADETSMLSIEAYFLNGKPVGTDSVSDDTTLIVTFSPNLGGGSEFQRTVAADGQFTFPKCEFTPPSPECAFAGWLVKDKTYQAGDTVTLTESVEAVAQWSGYGISGATINGGRVTLELINPVSASVSAVVCAYDGGGGLLASAVKTVDSGAAAELALQTSGAAYLKAFLLDPATCAPLCSPFYKKLS